MCFAVMSWPRRPSERSDVSNTVHRRVDSILNAIASPHRTRAMAAPSVGQWRSTTTVKNAGGALWHTTAHARSLNGRRVKGHMHVPNTRRISVLGSELRCLRTGRGPTVVLLHTLRTQLEYFVPLMRALDQDLEIVAPDLPGHGRSSAPRVEYTAGYFTDVVERLLDTLNLSRVLLVGESIGASIGLALAARRNPRLAGVVAINPYDYGRGGGIRRSSPLANVVFTAMNWPLVGSVVARTGSKGILRRVMTGGVYDPRNLPSDLVDELWVCGKLPGHARAFLSLSRQWRSWIAARAGYSAAELPITLVYGDHDWSRPEDREANGGVLRTARRVTLEKCGHFSCLDQPGQIARLVRNAVSRASGS
jgi:pimeloyl-ACP methyl ester carboxylesterase